MSGKYGLQLRGPPASAAKNPKPVRNKLPIFNDDDDDDVEHAIARQASKNRALQEVEQQHKRALEQDPTIFDYDAVYDEMKGTSARLVKQEPDRSKPKYITKLLEKAKVRQQEHDIIYERKLAKERALEDHLYGDKDKFVTGAYKKKLAEQAKWLEEERLRDLREQAEEVTKKSDLSDFYRNLFSKNVAFGAGAIKKDETAASPEFQQARPAQPMESGRHLRDLDTYVKTEQETMVQASSNKEEVPFSRNGGEDMDSLHQLKKSVPVSDSGPDLDTSKEAEMSEINTKLSKEVISTDGQAILDVSLKGSLSLPSERRPTEDAIAAAKERYLSRKRVRGS